MLKKLIPFVLMVFVGACANTQPACHHGTSMKMPCCEKCECCKDGQCSCCKDGSCKMCLKGSMSSMKEGKECPMCAKAERKWKDKQGTMKH